MRCFPLLEDAAYDRGTCVLNRAPYTFAATVIDNGEPGKEDVFMIRVASALSAGGVLRGGNVRVQVP